MENCPSWEEQVESMLGYSDREILGKFNLVGGTDRASKHLAPVHLSKMNEIGGPEVRIPTEVLANFKELLDQLKVLAGTCILISL